MVLTAGVDPEHCIIEHEPVLSEELGILVEVIGM